jgi:hypothetical protein
VLTVCIHDPGQEHAAPLQPTEKPGAAWP